MNLSRIPKTRRPAAEALVFELFHGASVAEHPFWKFFSPTNQRYLKRFIAKGFTNKKGEVDFVVFPSGKPSMAFLVGLGAHKDWNAKTFRLFCRRLVSIAESQKVQSLAVSLPSCMPHGMEHPTALQQAAEAVLMAAYRFSPYKKERSRRLTSVTFCTNDARGESSALRQGKVVAEAVNWCRDLANTPASHMQPKDVANAAREVAKLPGCSVRVLGKKELQKENMGAILAVAEGSSQDPHFLILRYTGGGKKDAPLVFAGKGITFDTGGVNLKPTPGLQDMHMDMAGGAAVIAAIKAIAQLRLPVNVIGLVPAVENMLSGSGYRPGDVIRSRSGKTIEVGNTDAEGRVVLADALAFAQTYKPALVVDVATLTGAALVALGQHYIALFSDRDAVAATVAEHGASSGDDAWRLPMTAEFTSEVRGTVGEWSNTGKVRWGDASHAAAFLRQFVGSFPWAHLDIAPTMVSAEGQFLTKGATGSGVRLLVALAESAARNTLSY